MFKTLKNISLKYKILIMLYVLIIIPFFTMQYLYYSKSADIISKKSLAYSDDLLKIFEIKMDNFCQDIIKVSDDMRYDQRIYNLLKLGSEESSRGYYNNVNYIKVTREASEALRDITLSSRDIQAICLITKDNNLLSYDSNIVRFGIQQIMPYDKMVKKIKSANGRPVWFIDVKDNKVENIYLARLFKDRTSLNDMGIAVMLIKNKAIMSVYSDIAPETIKNIAILAENGEILFENFENKSILSKINPAKLENKRGSSIDKEINSLISYVKLKNAKWSIVTCIPTSELYREISDLTKTFVILCICTLLIVSIMGILFSIDILRPIKQLVISMKRIEKEGRYEEVLIERNDELGYLGKSFNAMSSKINYLVKWVYEEKLTRREAELKALQAQINPHFLFNTLESINWMAQLNGVAEISETVSALAALMEVNIGRDNKLIPLRAEFKYIDDYILILKVRNGDKLTIHKNVDENVLDIKIPRLLIQPLVENAICHGMEKSTRDIDVQINSRLEEEIVIIEIIDNGMGIKADRLEKLNKLFKDSTYNYFDSEEENKHKGIGLENVNHRIKLFYGDEYGLEIQSVYTEYTKVIVKIPLKIKNEGERFYVQGTNN